MQLTFLLFFNLGSWNQPSSNMWRIWFIVSFPPSSSLLLSLPKAWIIKNGILNKWVRFKADTFWDYAYFLYFSFIYLSLFIPRLLEVVIRQRQLLTYPWYILLPSHPFFFNLHFDNFNREIVVQFNADVADGMPWKFIPTQREVMLLQFNFCACKDIILKSYQMLTLQSGYCTQFSWNFLGFAL